MTQTSTILQYEGRIDALRGSIETIWGNTDDGIRYLDACSRAAADLNDIVDQRGVMELIVPVVGTKNAGKTTFCQLLITDPAAGSQLRSGYGRENATTSLTWLGVTAPARMDPHVETWKSLSREQMFDAGRPYLLVDVPGFNDAQPAARSASLRIMSMASVIVLVASWENMEIESLLTYLRSSGGATIIPVVVDDLFDSRDAGQVTRELSLFKERVDTAIPYSTVTIPVHIPRIDAVPPEKRDHMRTLATQRTRTAIQQALSIQTPGSAVLARARYEKLLAELRSRIKPFLDRVTPLQDVLLAREREVVEEITPQLIGDRKQLHAGIRAQLMTRAAQNCSGYWFPFRPFLHLLALTAGAWDRLVLALSGSFPSLALLLFHTRYNLRYFRKGQDEVRNALRARIDETVNEKIAEPHRIFMRAIQQNANRPAGFGDASPATRYRVHGLAAIEAVAQSIVERNISRVPLTRGVINGFAISSVLVWISLAMGPLSAVYGQFLSASSAALTAGSPATWQAFPVPSFGMLFVTASLVFAPVLAIAMIALSIAVRVKAVETCCSRVEQEIRNSITGLIENDLLTPYSEGRLKEAVSHLRKELDPMR